MSYEITGVVIAKNEAEDLPECLDAWSPACDELLVVDNESTDETPLIAESYGARVISAPMDEATGFAGLRNFGLEAVETSHALVFDADERPTGRLVESIRSALQTTDGVSAYRLFRRNAAFGGWLDHGRFSPDWQTRLFPTYVRYAGVVHEVPILGADSEVFDLDGVVEHFTYNTLKEYLAKMRDYADKQSRQQPAPTLKHMLGLPLYNLLVRQGYKDGWRGYAMALGDGWSDFMHRQYSKALEESSAVEQFDTSIELIPDLAAETIAS